MPSEPATAVYAQSAVVTKRIRPVCAIPQHICALLSDAQHSELFLALLTIISSYAQSAAYMRAICVPSCVCSTLNIVSTAPAVHRMCSHCASCVLVIYRCSYMYIRGLPDLLAPHPPFYPNTFALRIFAAGNLTTPLCDLNTNHCVLRRCLPVCGTSTYV